MKPRLLRVSSTIALMMTLLTFGDVSWTQAQTTRQSLSLPAPPAGLPPRNRQRGGGSRGIECSKAKLDLAALVPSYPLQKQLKQSQAAKSIVWGKTSSDRPSFWFYTPYTRSHYRAQFSLIDLETGSTYPKAGSLLPTEAGIFQIASPAPLTVGKRYRWNLKIFCNADPTQRNVGTQSLTEVDGIVERVSLDPNATNQLRSATTDSMRLDIYVEQGLWFDALTTLVTLQQKNPSTWSGTWKDWLETIGLADIAEQPLAK